MKRLIQLLSLIIFTSCNNKPDCKTDDIKKQAGEVSSLDRDRLDNYFDGYEITPSITVNNIEGDQTDVQLSTHRIKWIGTDAESRIKIDNDLFTLKGKKALNIVWEEKGDVNFANNWDEMKLYQFGGREIIGIRMSPHPCTGLSCSVDYFLVYDLLTKTKSFFGTFRTDNKLALYDFDKDGRVDYLSKTFRGDPQGSTPMEFIYKLYTMKYDGSFIQQRNMGGQTYEIKQTTFPNDTTKTETFEQRWLTEIK